MATRFYLTDTASDINPGSELEQKLSLTAGASLATTTTNTTASGTNIRVTATAGGTIVQWLSAPLDGVDISGTVITFNLWVAESNMSANIQPGISVWICNNDGTQRTDVLGGTIDTPASEMAVTTRAVKNFLETAANSKVIAAGERLQVLVYISNFGTMGGGFTGSMGYSGPTAAADGDSWVEFTPTITEQTAAAANPPYRNPMVQLLAH